MTIDQEKLEALAYMHVRNVVVTFHEPVNGDPIRLSIEQLAELIASTVPQCDCAHRWQAKYLDVCRMHSRRLKDDERDLFTWFVALQDRDDDETLAEQRAG